MLCTQVLECDPDPAPCRGFTGDCSDLQAQFSGVQGAIPDDFYCAAFPDDDSQMDSLIVGLIGAAVMFPVGGFLQLLFALSNEARSRARARLRLLRLPAPLVGHHR